MFSTTATRLASQSDFNPVIWGCRPSFESSCRTVLAGIPIRERSCPYFASAYGNDGVQSVVAAHELQDHERTAGRRGVRLDGPRTASRPPRPISAPSPIPSRTPRCGAESRVSKSSWRSFAGCRQANWNAGLVSMRCTRPRTFLSTFAAVFVHATRCPASFVFM